LVIYVYSNQFVQSVQTIIHDKSIVTVQFMFLVQDVIPHLLPKQFLYYLATIINGHGSM